MAKFAGSVGYVTETEINPGIWSPAEEVRKMQGDVLRAASVFQGNGKVNEDITLQNRISLVGDSYALLNFFDIRWIEYMGVKWEVTMIDVVRPRIILTLGGVWRENKA